MNIGRREILRSTASLVTLGMAGCVSDTTEINGENSTEFTEKDSGNTTSTTINSETEDLEWSSMEATSKVVVQESADTPAEIILSLTNRGQKNVSIGFGPALLYTDDSMTSLSWSDELVLDPDTRGVNLNGSTKQETDCWWFEQNGPVVVQSSLEFHDIKKGEHLSETFSIYTKASSETCLPQGAYTFQDVCYLNSETNQGILTMTIKIESDKELTTAAKIEGINTDT